ncbi:LysR family transcriptional regulator [Streptomyces sp. NPDC004726]
MARCHNARMERRQIEYFVAVADSGSFGRAAAELHVTQPTLSQAMAQLEKELGVQLFRRTSKGVVLTPGGKAAIEPARRALRGMSAIRSAVMDVVGLTGGTLDIASLPTLSQSPVSPLIAEFRMRHPQVKVTIRSPSQPRIPEIAEMVRMGVCELGFTEQLDDAQGLQTLPLGHQDFVAVVPSETQLQEPGVATWDEVLACGLVIGPWWESSRPAACLDQRYGRHEWRKHVAVRTDHREAYIPLLVAGAGATFLPRFEAELAGAAGALVADLTPKMTRSAALVRSDEALSPAAREFWDMVGQRPTVLARYFSP